MRRVLERGAAGILVAALLAGCSGTGNDIADQIRAADSPLVVRVDVSPANPIFGGKNYDDVHVFLVGSVTDQQAIEFYCTVVLPTHPERIAPGRIYFERGAHFFPEGGSSPGEEILQNPVCPDSQFPDPTG